MADQNTRMEAPLLVENGVPFRDLNKNGRLDPYEDPRRPVEERVADLLAQMTLEEKAGLLASFGASDEAVLDIIFGAFAPGGKLPFELPSSMEAVRKHKEDLPYDLENPLFPFGFGLSF